PAPVSLYSRGPLAASHAFPTRRSSDLTNGSVLNAGDLAGNIFGVLAGSTVLSVPIIEVPLLAGNKSFEDINLNAGSLNTGQTVAISRIHASTPVTLS